MAKRANVTAGRHPLGPALNDLRLVDQLAARRGRAWRWPPRPEAGWSGRAQAGAGDLDHSAVIATITGDGR